MKTASLDIRQLKQHYYTKLQQQQQRQQKQQQRQQQQQCEQPKQRFNSNRHLLGNVLQ